MSGSLGLTIKEHSFSPPVLLRQQTAVERKSRSDDGLACWPLPNPTASETPISLHASLTTLSFEATKVGFFTSASNESSKSDLSESGSASSISVTHTPSSFSLTTEKEKDEVISLSKLEDSALKGDAHAQVMLGIAYLKGQWADQNGKKAGMWFQLAAQHKDAPESLYAKGVCYENGLGVPKDEQEALRLYQLSAGQGYSVAQHHIGICYEEGKGFVQNEKEAVRWYWKAAEQGNVFAQIDLGTCYEKGKGVIQDKKEAAKWYRKAAE